MLINRLFLPYCSNEIKKYILNGIIYKDVKR